MIRIVAAVVGGVAFLVAWPLAVIVLVMEWDGWREGRRHGTRRREQDEQEQVSVARWRATGGEDR